MKKLSEIHKERIKQLIPEIIEENKVKIDRRSIGKLTGRAVYLLESPAELNKLEPCKKITSNTFSPKQVTMLKKIIEELTGKEGKELEDYTKNALTLIQKLTA